MQIKVFIRHCNFSKNSVHKNRPSWYTREGCWENMKRTADENTEITIMFDGKPNEDHFLLQDKDKYKIVEKKGGSDGHSFLNLLNYVETLPLDDNDIVYFVEDDYLHRPGWCEVMREAFDYVGSDYVTLYDHFDTYRHIMYATLQSKIYATKSCHWRTAPSTTNTYAMLFKTLKRDMRIHKSYCDLSIGYTRDFEKFLNLGKEGKVLVSSIPGYSTHCETEFLSPVVNWQEFI